MRRKRGKEGTSTNDRRCCAKKSKGCESIVSRKILKLSDRGLSHQTKKTTGKNRKKERWKNGTVENANKKSSIRAKKVKWTNKEALAGDKSSRCYGK